MKSRQLDILFVHANAASAIYQALASEHSAIETPIWAGMLAQSVRSRGFGTAILDCEAERLSAVSAVEIVKAHNPRIVCFVVYGQQPSASTQNMTGATLLSNLVKDELPGSKTLFVGPHVAAGAGQLLRKETSIDFACQNEGVYTIHNLLEVENLDDVASLEKVNGLAFRKTSTDVHVNPVGLIVAKKNLEIDLPGIAWDLLPSPDKYRTTGWHSWTNDSEKSPFASIYTSLGCPYRCSFCMINIINRTKAGTSISSQDSNVFRWWSPEFIIGEFDKIAAMGIKNVKIADELFVLNPNHFLLICDLIIERGYHFNIWAYSRVDTCKPSYLAKLKQAGVNWLTLGIENPNAILRKEIHKDSFQEVRIGDQIKTMRDAGISVGGNYIFGLPMDTHESMQGTLDFALANPTEMTNMYCAMAYPGSPLHIQAVLNGQQLPEHYTGYSQHSYDTTNLASENLGAAEILAFRDKAWMTYHTDPGYLSMIETKFGPKARAGIEETTKIKLKRKLLGD